MTYLKKLSQISLPDLINLDHDALVDEVVSRIKLDPDWNAQWDGDLYQNASYAIINYFSYLHGKIAESQNRSVREAFMTQARDPQSIVDHLSDYGLSLQQNTASVVTVTGSVLNGALTQNLTIPVSTKLPALGLNSDEILFEVIKKDIVDQSKYDYESDTTVLAGVDSFELTAYAGETFKIDTVLNPPADVEKFTYTIPYQDIIEGSIRIYYEFNNILLKTELLETKTFVVPKVISVNFPDGIPHFKIKYFTDGSAQIIFGTEKFGGAFPTGGPSNITIFGRKGGGRNSNITPRKIKHTINYQLNTNNITTINFTNLINATGGNDRESVFEAQYYAPHRIGRNSSIVSDDDVLNEFSSKVVKHRVDSPKYSEVANNVPLLHYQNFVVPSRDFTNFIFPAVSVNDTVTTYTQRFLKELNKFLNLRKIHDQLESDEVVSFFNSNDFSYILELNPPLNGSLYLSAFDHTNTEIDRLKFTNNYVGSTNAPDAPTDIATVKTNSAVGIVTITTGFNDKIKFSIDEEDPLNPGTGAGVVHTISVSPGLYGTPDILALDIDTKIKASSSYFSANPTYQYCLVQDGKIVIRSKTTGQYSRVQILDVANSIYSTINLSVQLVRATPTSGLVFLGSTNYDLTLNTVSIKLNSNRFNQDIFFPAPFTAWPDSSSATGPQFDHQILEENNINLAYPILGTNVIVRAVHSISNSILDEVTFTAVTNNVTNTGVITGTGNVFDDAQPGFLNLDYVNATLHFKLLDSTDPGPTYSFPAGYDTNLKFEIIYQRKTYKFITASYYPNPYFNEDETAEYAAILRGKDKRQLCVEPIFKRINFIPVKIQATVKAKKSKSPNQAILDTKTIIDQRFSYANTDLDNNIGTGFSVKRLSAILNENVILNPNTQRVNIITPPNDIEDNSSNLNQYYFVLGDDMIEEMTQIENNNVNLTGFTIQFKTVLTVE